jgi:hypothetical protein
MVPEVMSTQGAHYEPFAWWLTRERIGQDLRERCSALEELPSRLLVKESLASPFPRCYQDARLTATDISVDPQAHPEI